MKTFGERDITGLDKAFRTALINGISGTKSANLIATKNKEGHENVALFSSVIHLGANPPLLGFVMRPVHVERHTYLNILETNVFTVNAVEATFQQNAHQTSARYPREVSEFEACGLTPLYENGFPAPFVSESPLRVGCTVVEDIEIISNRTRLIVGKVHLVTVKDELLRADGSLDLSAGNIAAITGLDEWHQLSQSMRYAYAKPFEETKIIKP